MLASAVKLRANLILTQTAPLIAHALGVSEELVWTALECIVPPEVPSEAAASLPAPVRPIQEKPQKLPMAPPSKWARYVAVVEAKHNPRLSEGEYVRSLVESSQTAITAEEIADLAAQTGWLSNKGQPLTKDRASVMLSYLARTNKIQHLGGKRSGLYLAKSV